MRAHRLSFDGCKTIRLTLLAAALILPAVVSAQTADLVAHNGFEACWSRALTKPQFLDLMQTTLDGARICIGSQSITQSGTTITVCNTAMCPGGQIGCPVNVHVPDGTFTGDFATGTFVGFGSADDIVVPVSFTGAINDNCTITIANAALKFAPDYVMTADGNSGAYAAALTQAPMTLENPALSGSDLYCTLAVNGYGADLQTAAQAQGTIATEARLRAGTLGESICPLTP